MFLDSDDFITTVDRCVTFLYFLCWWCPRRQPRIVVAGVLVVVAVKEFKHKVELCLHTRRAQILGNNSCVPKQQTFN